MITMCIMSVPSKTQPRGPVLLTLRVSPRLKEIIKTAADDNRLKINETANLLIEAGLELIRDQHGGSLAAFIAARQRTSTPDRVLVSPDSIRTGTLPVSVGDRA